MKNYTQNWYDFKKTLILHVDSVKNSETVLSYDLHNPDNCKFCLTNMLDNKTFEDLKNAKTFKNTLQEIKKKFF